MFPVLLRSPVLQLTLDQVLALLLPPALVLAVALSLAPTLVLAMALSLALGQFLAMVLVKVPVLLLELAQALALALRLAPALLKGSEISGQICSLIIPPGVPTASGNLRNNQPGNFCKSQNLVLEGYGNPKKLKGSLSFTTDHYHGAIAFSTTGRKREPPITWIKSQVHKMALRVSSSDMGTRDC